MNKILNTIIIAIIITAFFGCDNNNFTDPNDPRFGSLENGIKLNIDNTFQVIDHFGASGGFQDQWVGKWPNSTKDQIAKLLFSTETDSNGNPLGIGLSLWRTVIGDGAADQSDSGFLPSVWYDETECYLDNLGNYNWSKQSGEQWFLSKAKEYGINKFSAWVSSPPYFMTQNGYTFRTNGVNGFNLQQDKLDDFSIFLAEVLKNYESKGYNFLTVSPFNETQYEWDAVIGSARQSGSKASNTEIANVLRIMDDIFTQNNISAKIMIPEAAQLKHLYSGNNDFENQINTFFRSDSQNYIGDLKNISKHIAGHSYFSNNTTFNSLNQRKSLRTAIVNSGKDLDYWQTEYSLLGSDYLQGRSSSSMRDIDYALWLTKIIHTDIVFGDATGWSFWTALNQSTFDDHPNRFNLILYQPNSNSPSNSDGTFRAVKNLWALGNYSFFVRPGMVRFEVIDPNYNEINSLDNFMISGFKDTNTKEIVLVFVNNTVNDREISFEGYSTDFEIDQDTFEMYVTSQTDNLKRSVVKYDQVKIPSKSIVTLKGKIK